MSVQNGAFVRAQSRTAFIESPAETAFGQKTEEPPPPDPGPNPFSYPGAVTVVDTRAPYIPPPCHFEPPQNEFPPPGEIVGARVIITNTSPTPEPGQPDTRWGVSVGGGTQFPRPGTLFTPNQGSGIPFVLGPRICTNARVAPNGQIVRTQIFDGFGITDGEFRRDLATSSGLLRREMPIGANGWGTTIQCQIFGSFVIDTTDPPGS